MSNVDAIKKALEAYDKKDINVYGKSYTVINDLHDLLTVVNVRELLTTLEALQRENARLRKERYDLAFAITGGEDAPGLLDSIPSSHLVKIAKDTHSRHSAEIDRSVKAEAEVKRLRDRELSAYEFVKRHPSLTIIDLAEFEAFLKVPEALASAGEHHAE